MGLSDRLREAAQDAKKKGRDAAGKVVESTRDRLEDPARAAASEVKRRSGLAAGEARAATREASRQGAKSVSEIGEKLGEQHPEALARATRTTSGAVEKGRSAGKEIAERRRKTEARLAETRRGERFGRLFQRGAGALNQLPLLSLVPDVMNEKNGITELSAALRSDPNDPYLVLWLGEALRSQERDARLYTSARTVADPTYLLGREAIKSAARLGAPAAGSGSEQHLRRAFYLAQKRIEADASDGDGYHVIARYYLAAGRPEGGCKAAKRAISCTGGAARAQALVTLARVYMAMGLPAAGRVAADGAIRCGCTVGYEVLADLVYQAAPAKTTKQRMREFAELRSRVTPEDRIAYYGTYRTMSATARAVAVSQLLKARRQASRAREAARTAKQRLTASDKPAITDAIK